MRKSINNLSTCFVMVAFLSLFSFIVSAQTITGKVTDPVGSGLEGVTVNVKGTKNSVKTDARGTFTINAPANASLVFSSVGYNGVTTPVNGRNSINLTITPSNTTLNDVVVVAYGTRRKSDLTGSVTSVSAKDFQKGFIPSSEQLLQGKVAGLQVTSGGGYAGGGSKIRIRGGASLNSSNDPLIVIDGVPVESNTISGSGNLLNTINPNDIESMSVLKDASATALYGSRASNGVIIITTKKGNSGKILFNYNTQFSVGDVAKRVQVLSADQVRTIINDDATATGNNAYKKLLGNANTDWQKEIFQKAIGFDHNISASGSLEKIPFRASLGYLNQEGILKTDKFNRFSSALNISPRFLNDHLSVNVNLKFSQTNNRFANVGAVGSALAFDPTQSARADNKYGGYYETLQADGTPLELATRNPLGLLYLNHNTSIVSRFIGNVQLDYKLHFLPDLHVLFNLGMDHTEGRGDNNKDSTAAYAYKTHGSMSHYAKDKNNTVNDIQLYYTKQISFKSKFDILIGHTYQDFYDNVYNFPSFSQRSNKDILPGTIPPHETDKPEYRLESYLGRLNINLGEKYLITASVRSDATSKLAPGNRVGYFPSVAFAWRLKEEFFKTTSAVSDLKLRLSWGNTGQQDGIDYYSYLPRYSLSDSGALYQFGNKFFSFLRPTGYDPTIRWESTRTDNIGLDFGFLNNRISGSVDVYFRKTKDLLSNVPVAPGGNFVNQIVTNVGNIDNKGFEFTLNTTPVKSKNFSWDFGFNVGYNKNTITNLLKNPNPNFQGITINGIGGGTGNTIGINAIGYAPSAFFVRKQIYDQNGKPLEGLYEDLNRDGQINASDFYIYKKPSPDFLVGLNTQFFYKKISLSIAAHGMEGNYLYNNYFSGNGALNSIKSPLSIVGNASVNYLDTRFANSQYLSDYYIENASFLRIDNINFGYNIGKVLKNKASMRISASIQNVAVITKYRGLDPENSNDSGVDGNIYPRPRVYSFGLNFDF